MDQLGGEQTGQLKNNLNYMNTDWLTDKWAEDTEVESQYIVPSINGKPGEDFFHNKIRHHIGDNNGSKGYRPFWKGYQ